MKIKHLFIALLLLVSSTLFAQTKVAVYVVESELIDESIRKIVGSEVVSAIVKNKNYQAVERTSTFLAQISKEQSNDNDQQISEIGKMLGVDNVCVIDITPFQSSYYIQARLLDVNNGLVLATAREVSSLSDIEDVISSTEAVSSKLIKSSYEEKTIANIEPVETAKEYSTIGFFSNTTQNLHFVSIENKNGSTVVTLKFCTPQSTWISIKPETYLLDKSTNRKYYLIRGEGIAYSPQKTELKTGGIYLFKLYFAGLPTNSTFIDFIEPDGWCAYNISLRPYGSENFHVFVDNSEANMAKLAKEYNDLMDSYGNMVESFENLTTYNLKVTNKKLTPRAIYIKGEYIGQVDARKEKTFKVALRTYGACRTIQTSGYLISPSEESFTIPKPHSGQTITLTIN